MKQKHLFFSFLCSILFISAYGQIHHVVDEKLTKAEGEHPGIFWKIEKEGMSAPAYLFGTYHLLNDGYLSKWPTVREAYLNSDKVVVEMIVDSSQIGQAMMAGMMTDQSLLDLLDSTEYALVSHEVQQTMMVPLSQLNRMKPILIAGALTMAYNQNAFPELADIDGVPLDLYFADEGEKTGKEVIGLESLMEQSILLYESNSVEEQAEDLVQMVREKDEALQLTDDIIRAYTGNDFNSLERLGAEDFDHWGSIDHLLDERNERWLEQIPGLLDEGSVFIAVGALHLTGKTGLVKELRKLGYSVNPVGLK